MKKIIQSIIYDPIISNAWWRMVRLWRPMGLWTLITWGLMAAVLTPLMSAVLGWQFLKGGELVIGNRALLSWLVTPEGLLYLVLFAGFAIVGAVIHFAGLFQIVTDDLEGQPATVVAGILHILPRIPILVRLCVYAAAVGLGLILPLIAGLALFYYGIPAAFDLNYYLAAEASGWPWQIIGAVSYVFVWTAAALWVAGRSLLALPAYLDGYRPIGKALKKSWRITARRAGRMLHVLLLSVGLWVLLRLLVDALLFAGSTTVLNQAAGGWPLRYSALLTGFFILGVLILQTLITFMGFCHVSTVLSKLYYEDTDLHTGAPDETGFRHLTAGTARILKWGLHPRRLLPGLITILAASSIASGWLLEQLHRPEPVEIVAHRAGPRPAPENTLAALEQSVELGADYAEIDLQLTSDSVVVAVHDADLMRVANRPYRVTSTSYDSLNGVVKAGPVHIPPKQRKVEHLESFLKAARDRIGLILELKYYEPQPALVERVLAAVDSMGMADQVKIMSMKQDAALQVLRQHSDIESGYVAAYTIGTLGNLPFHFLAVSLQIASADLLAEAAGNGMESYVWTVNTRDAIAEWILKGADGIITDQPALAIEVREELKKMSAAERLLLRFRLLVS